MGEQRFACGRYLEAAYLFKLMVTSTELQVGVGVCMGEWVDGGGVP